MGETKITLPESAIPPRWYNIAADMPNRPQPVLHPGHGHFDLGAYDAYLHGQLEDFELPEDEIARALTAIEPLPKPAGVS
jgi:predicted alternative tryptophan synthase beta-subunit